MPSFTFFQNVVRENVIKIWASLLKCRLSVALNNIAHLVAAMQNNDCSNTITVLITILVIIEYNVLNNLNGLVGVVLIVERWGFFMTHDFFVFTNYLFVVVYCLSLVFFLSILFLLISLLFLYQIPSTQFLFPVVIGLQLFLLCFLCRVAVGRCVLFSDVTVCFSSFTIS